MCMREGGVWGIVVAVVSFLAQATCFGTMSCIGLYTIPLLQDFDATHAEVSLVGSINYAVTYMTGPVGSMLLAKWSHRKVALIGAILANIGLVAMPFAPNLFWMYIFYGIFVGLGFSLVYMPSHVLCAFYYSNKRLSVVTAIVTAGSGFGLVVMPPIANYFIGQYGWRISFFAIAGINMSQILCAALLRPVDDTQLNQRLIDDHEQLDDTPNTDETMGNGNTGQVKPGYQYIASTCELTTKEQCDVENQIETNNGVLEGQSKIANGLREVGDVKQQLTNESKGTSRPRWQAFVSEIRPLLQFDYIVFSVGCLCWGGAGQTYTMFVPEFSVSEGTTESQASMQISIYGVTFTIGCVVIGLILNSFKRINVFLMIAASIGGGVMPILATLHVTHNFWGLSLISVTYGLALGCFWGALVDAMTDLVGVQYLSNAYGMAVLAIGLGMVCAPPVAGILVGKFERVACSMYVAGIVTLLGAVAMVIVRIRRPVCSD